jgi:hypothetical protein
METVFAGYFPGATVFAGPVGTISTVFPAGLVVTRYFSVVRISAGCTVVWATVAVVGAGWQLPQPPQRLPLFSRRSARLSANVARRTTATLSALAQSFDTATDFSPFTARQAMARNDNIGFCPRPFGMICRNWRLHPKYKPPNPGQSQFRTNAHSHSHKRTIPQNRWTTPNFNPAVSEIRSNTPNFPIAPVAHDHFRDLATCLIPAKTKSLTRKKFNKKNKKYETPYRINRI